MPPIDVTKEPDSSRCPRCGSPAPSRTAAGGICLRCAGERVLSGAIEGRGSLWDDQAAHTGSLPGDIPRRIGSYEIIEELGRGGMGRVYAARQIDLGRIVALKAIAGGWEGSVEQETRFLREAQTVARLRHPNIVSVHDSGRADGYVYFSMDYIDGGDLSVRLRNTIFSSGEAALLLQKIASALAYAHGQGVLHRDIKPSNILLDGNEPKIADFGLAAQLEAGGDLTAVTGILGTPHYLAPEALQGGSAALTVASDLYALGVLLFAMLTGRTPFAGASPAELPTLLSESEPPSPRLFNPSVAKDLETICLKCLERDPHRRYSDAAALAEDLRRFLAGEPVLAQPPGTLYLLQKFAQKNRAAVIAAGAIFAILLAATIVSSFQAVRATRAEKRATIAAATSQEVTDFLENDLLAQAAPDEQPDRDIRLMTVLDRAAKKIDGRFADRPLVEASLRETLAGTYESLGDYADEDYQWQRVIALRTRNLGPEDPKTLIAIEHEAETLAQEDKLKEGEALGLKVLDSERRVFGPDNEETIGTMTGLVFIFKAEGKLSNAEAIGKEAVDAGLRALGMKAQQTRTAMINLSSIYWAEGKLAEAETLNVKSLEAQREALGPENPGTLIAMSNLASVYWTEGRLSEAEKLNLQILEIRKRVLGPEHPQTLRSMHNLATTYHDEGRFAEATALEQETLRIRRKVMGPEHSDTLSTMVNIALDELGEGKLEDARTIANQTLELCMKVLGPAHFQTLQTESALARIDLELGRMDEAQAMIAKAVETSTRTSGAASRPTLQLVNNQGRILNAAGRYAQAEALLRPAFAAWQKIAPNSWQTYATQIFLGRSLAGEKRYPEAEEDLVQGRAGLEKTAGSVADPKEILAESGLWLKALTVDRGKPAVAEKARSQTDQTSSH